MERRFKENLRAELDYVDLTVKELSKRTGIAKRTLDCYLGARASMPPADIATQIAAALGVTVEYLILGQEFTKKEAHLDQNTRSIIQILAELNKKDAETVLELAKILQKQSEKQQKKPR